MAKDLSLDDLWNSALTSDTTFRPVQISGLPEAARRYLEHAIAPGARLASSVRLRMHGKIKLKGWLPFTAEQVIRQGRDMIWCATVGRNISTIRGFDRFVDGEGAMRWKLFGLFSCDDCFRVRYQSFCSGSCQSGIGLVAVHPLWR